jgi:uncharacterized protein YqhQ
MASRLAAGAPTPGSGVPSGYASEGARPEVSETASASPNDMLQAQRDAPLGGQAVLEGVMMRGIRNWAVAVRKPGVEVVSANGDSPPEPLGEIEVTTFALRSALRRHRWLRVPVLRGIVALGESLAIGFKALGVSANAQLAAVSGGEEGEEPMEISGGMWAGTIVVALVFAIGLFFLLPLGLTSLIKDQLHSSVLFWIVEGALRTAIFLGYMVLLSRLRDLRRVFEYHGAEHKTISCFEAGLDLTPENAQRFSRLHPRCGTSFLLIVMIVSIFVFGAVGLPAWYLLVASRIIGVPLIAGISFEIIKFAGRNRRRRWVRAVMWPGMQLQLLTTREPDLDQLAVAIASLEAVLALEDPSELSAKDLVGVEVVA